MKLFYIIGESNKEYLITADSAYKANLLVKQEETRIKYAKIFNSGNYNNINSLLKLT